MPLTTPKARSVHEPEGPAEAGRPDGWEPQPGFVRDVGPGGRTQLVASVPVRFLLPLHLELVQALSRPLGFLYRRVIDRRNPGPQGTPPRDFVVLDQPVERVVDVLRRYSDLLHHDARCEVWIRGALGDHVVLDTDGLLYCAPDDPAFRDVLLGNGLTEGVAETIADRDFVEHLFHAENDALESQLIAELQLTEYAPRGH